MRKNERGENNGTTETENHRGKNPQKQVAAQPKPSKKINWNNTVLVGALTVWLLASVFLGYKIVASSWTEKQTAGTEMAAPSTAAQSPKPSTAVQSPKPSTAAQSPKPSTAVQSPKPSTAVQSPKPSTAVQSPKPSTAVQSPKPSTAVQSPKPTATPAPANTPNPTQNNETPTSATVALVTTIREEYYNAQKNLSNCEVKNIGTSTKAYFLDSRLILLRETVEKNLVTGKSSEGNFEQYWYYNNGDVYFVFMNEVSTKKEYRLYFSNGKLIRWIDSDGKVYNSSYRWDEMQKFYDYAKAQCDSASGG